MRVNAWLELKSPHGTFKCTEDIEVPDNCKDDRGNLIESDVAEFVEVWFMEYLTYGASVSSKSSDSSSNQKLLKARKHLHEALDGVLDEDCKKLISFHIEKAMGIILEVENQENSEI